MFFPCYDSKTLLVIIRLQWRSEGINRGENSTVTATIASRPYTDNLYPFYYTPQHFLFIMTTYQPPGFVSLGPGDRADVNQLLIWIHGDRSWIETNESNQTLRQQTLRQLAE